MLGRQLCWFLCNKKSEKVPTGENALLPSWLSFSCDRIPSTLALSYRKQLNKVYINMRRSLYNKYTKNTKEYSKIYLLGFACRAESVLWEVIHTNLLGKNSETN